MTADAQVSRATAAAPDDRSDDAAFVAAVDRALCDDVPVADDLEAALHSLCRVAHETLGDRAAARRPGALLPGERDYRVAGCFLVTPDRRYNMLVGNVGFPPEQRRLAIPIDWSHPGRVVATAAPLLLANTDDHGSFRQYLKTSRMGSAVYAPIVTRTGLVGQIVAAAQARHTYDASDLRRLQMLAGIAALAWPAFDGAHWLAADYPPDDAWYADRESDEPTD